MIVLFLAGRTQHAKQARVIRSRCQCTRDICLSLPPKVLRFRALVRPVDVRRTRAMFVMQIWLFIKLPVIATPALTGTGNRACFESTAT